MAVEKDRVSALWRFPVKSMRGEEVNAVEVTATGVVGDRQWALVDGETGKVASAKNPRLWPRLLDMAGRFITPPSSLGSTPVRIELVDGRFVTSDDDDVDGVLSDVVGRKVSLQSSAPQQPTLEEYWPDIEGLAHREATTDEPMPARTFFDVAMVHVMTTSTLRTLRALHPEGLYDLRRFRPNIVVATEGEGFVENDWVGRELAIGDDVRLKIDIPCGRCVMTTLQQSELPADLGILATPATHNSANIGVYASVVRGGTIQRAAEVRLV